MVLKVVTEIIQKQFSCIDFNLLESSINQAAEIKARTKQSIEIETQKNCLQDKLNELVCTQIKMGISPQIYQKEYEKIRTSIKRLDDQLLNIQKNINDYCKKMYFDKDLIGFLKDKLPLTPKIVSNIICKIYRLSDNSVLIVLNKESYYNVEPKFISEHLEHIFNIPFSEITDGKRTLKYRIYKEENNEFTTTSQIRK